MLIINTTKRALIYAIGKMKDPKKYEGEKTPDFSNGFPKDIKRIISAQEVPIDELKGLADHAHFLSDLARGYLFMVGNGELLRSFPMKKKAAAPATPAEKKKGKEKNARQTKVEEIDFEEIETWPQSLNDVKDLSEFTERDAIDLVSVTVDLKALKRWRKSEAADNSRTGLVDVLKTIITKVESIDKEREKVGAGAEE